MPPNHPVQVKYQANQTPPISFQPASPINVDKRGSTITFSISNGSDPFDFSEIYVSTQTITCPPPSSRSNPGEFTYVVAPDGGTLTLTDADTDLTETTYNYAIAVTPVVNGQQQPVVWSDPQIVNKPEAGVP